MLVLVGTVKKADRVVREMMGKAAVIPFGDSGGHIRNKGCGEEEVRNCPAFRAFHVECVEAKKCGRYKTAAFYVSLLLQPVNVVQYQ